MNRYCLVNINGLKSKPLCKENLVLTKDEHSSGYRITKSTIGVGMTVESRNVRGRFINNYTFDKYKISFIWLASILADEHIVGSALSGSIMIELKLHAVHLMDEGRLINDGLPCNVLNDLVKQINDKLPHQLSGIKYVELDMIMMLFPTKYHKLFEYLVGLIKNKNANFSVTEKIPMVPTDVDLKMEIFK